MLLDASPERRAALGNVVVGFTMLAICLLASSVSCRGQGAACQLEATCGVCAACLHVMRLLPAAPWLFAEAELD